MVDLLTAAIVGMLSSVVASAVFLVAISRIRPKLVVSPYIARSQDGSGKFHGFKIINKSRRPVIDVRADVALAKFNQAAGGPVYWTRQIPLVKNYIFHLGPFREDDKEAMYALRFVANCDIDEIWNDDRDIIRFRVIATDALTGFSKCEIMDYRLPRHCIKNGLHEWGPGLDVK